MYKFDTDVSIPEKNELFVYHDNIFSDDELGLIESYCSKILPLPARIYDITDAKSDARRCTATSIQFDRKIDFLYDRIRVVSQILNSRFYNFKLDGLFEPLQYLQYDSSIQGHYASHIDSGPTNIPPRKLSIVLQMTDPAEYEGGDLQIIINDDPVCVPKKKNRLIVFPSFRLHRVTPVTAGMRKTIVGWITGPSFV